MTDDASQNPRLCPEGLRIGTGTMPLYAGSVHYFRLARAVWQPALESLCALGVRFVDTAVPWGVHEQRAGEFDFGEVNPRLDVITFIELAARIGLRSIVRLGPSLAAQLTFGGLPERVVRDEACMARTRTGAPHVTATLPVAYPTPSYASHAFHAHAAVFLRKAAERLAPLAAEGGPVSLVVLGDEQRAGLFAEASSGGDYHPDAVAQYRRFLMHRYGNATALRRVHGAGVTFDNVEPPRDVAPPAEGALGPQLDWFEAQEAMVEGACYRYRAVLDRHGLGVVPKLYEQSSGPSFALVDPVRMERVANGLSFECRGRASDEGRRAIAATVTRAAARGAVRRAPVFASNVPAGFAADMPGQSAEDDLFVAMTALAYGARGLSLHTGVTRDRWVGGPIDAHGEPRASADQWARLFTALGRVQHWELSRKAAVHIAVPHLLERLSGLASAAAPVAPGSPDAGQSAPLAESEHDPSGAAVAEAIEFVATLERVLDRARVPYGYVAAEGLERSFGDAAWTIVVCPRALDSSLTAAIAQHALLGKPISVGPRAPERDAHFAPASARLPAIAQALVPLLLPRGPATLTELIETTVTDLHLPTLAAEPDVVRTTLHVDSGGRPRALFVINPSDDTLTARAAVPGAIAATDGLSGEDVLVTEEYVSLTVAPRTVRLLALASPL